jgi:SulP family sulfate permease
VISFRPRLLDCLRDYSRDKLIADTFAGLTVGIVALSLCIGLGIASGVSPQAGLYTGIVGGFIVAALGGSRVQIGGPAGAFVGLIALIVQNHGLSNLLICTMLAGGLMFVMGACRLGSLIRFVPQPVTSGFTCGIAITIFCTQISAFLGLDVPHEPAEFLPKVLALGQALPTAHWHAVAVGGAAIALLVWWPAGWGRRLPASILAVVAGTVAVRAEAPVREEVRKPAGTDGHLTVGGTAITADRHGAVCNDVGDGIHDIADGPLGHLRRPERSRRGDRVRCRASPFGCPPR